MQDIENIEAYFENFHALHEVACLANKADEACYANIQKLKTNPYFTELMPGRGTLLQLYTDQNKTLKELTAEYKLSDEDLAKLSTLMCAQVEQGISEEQKFIYISLVKLIMNATVSASIASGNMEGLTDFIAEPDDE